MNKKSMFFLLSIIAVFSLVLASCAQPAAEPVVEEAAEEPAEAEEVQMEPEEEAMELPPPPAFDSACTPEDEGTVAPVDEQPPT
ncbi:MAG: hypothetical protein ACK2TW_09480, partial [Anaerolineales bacterium]